MQFCTRGRLTSLKGKISLEYYEKVNFFLVYHKLMKTFLANALALSTILCWLKNFTSSSTIHFVPVNVGHCSHTKKWNPVPSLLAEATPCFELEIFKVNALATTGHLGKSIKAAPRVRGQDRR